ncbi:MAG: gamma-glutamylcyclotransferase [Candidatus Eisenbacteria bacterium]|nr:gamma-glutamylcyclotransferase [Candidatus Eisenbacteria bacterium]
MRTHATLFQAVLMMLYFAYGSNMNWPQMQKRCPGAKFHCVAKLPNHRLAFPRTSVTWQGGGVAGVVADSGHAVWGVVYELTQADLDSLDGYEGYKEGRAGNQYTRGTVTVLDRGREKKPLEALVYHAVPTGRHFAPGARYKKTIVDGAKHWKLPELYLEDLEKIEVAK